MLISLELSLGLFNFNFNFNLSLIPKQLTCLFFLSSLIRVVVLNRTHLLYTLSPSLLLSLSLALMCMHTHTHPPTHPLPIVPLRLLHVQSEFRGP
jgi:hypothetical protein